MVVGHYRIHQSTHDGLPVVTAVAADLSTRIDALLDRTPDIVDWLASVFGPYPFDAMGGIAIDDNRVGYALENQTRPIYGPVFFDGGDATWVVVHELAHQWYGDSVSVHDWSDVWLNEGFATYAEWLWQEHKGTSTAQQAFDDLYADANSEIWQVPPAALGVDHVFKAPGSEYSRGAMTLQALRMTGGDDTFFAILRQWAARGKDSNGTTAQFVALADQVSGRQLDPLLHDWLYGTVRPPRP
jgi:aminopeptidase N